MWIIEVLYATKRDVLWVIGSKMYYSPPLQMTGDLTLNFALTDNIKKVANFKKKDSPILDNPSVSA